MKLRGGWNSLLNNKTGLAPFSFSKDNLLIAGECLNHNIHNLKNSSHHLFFQGIIFNQSDLYQSTGLDKNVCSLEQVLSFIYYQKGADGFRIVNGQFAIIIYDVLKHIIHLISDHYGLHPMYYYIKNDVLIFGSEVKQVLTSPLCPREIDWNTALKRPIPNIVVSGFKSYNTWFKGIQLLPEGSILSFNTRNNDVTLKKYWSLEPVRDEAYQSDHRTVYDICQTYITLLEDAVRLRTRDESKRYSLFSGGLDSSSITSICAQQGPTHAFTLTSQSSYLDGSSDLCQKLSNEQHFDHSLLVMPLDDLRFTPDHWLQLLWNSESPFDNMQFFAKYLLHYKIHKQYPEVTSVFSGSGSDQLNGGFVRWIMKNDTIENRWEEVEKELVTLENQQFVAREDEPLWERSKFIHRKFLTDHNAKAAKTHPWFFYMDRAIHSCTYYILWDEIRASRIHGITSLFPFLDYRISDFICSISPRHYKELFYDKAILRKGIAQYLPDYIREKPKLPGFLYNKQPMEKVFHSVLSHNNYALIEKAFGSCRHNVIDVDKLIKEVKKDRTESGQDLAQILFIVNLGLLEELAKENRTLPIINSICEPVEIKSSDYRNKKSSIEQWLGIEKYKMHETQVIGFEKNCFLLQDANSKCLYLSKDNQLIFEVEANTPEWISFLRQIDGNTSIGAILKSLDVSFSAVEEYLMMAIRENILVLKEEYEAAS